jgi:hypothetical protein
MGKLVQCHCTKINNIGCMNHHPQCKLGDKCKYGKGCKFFHTIDEKNKNIFKQLAFSDVMRIIFDFLYMRQLVRISRVCIVWHNTIIDDNFWNNKYNHFIDNINYLNDKYKILSLKIFKSMPFPISRKLIVHDHFIKSTNSFEFIKINTNNAIKYSQCMYNEWRIEFENKDFNCYLWYDPRECECNSTFICNNCL